MLSAFALVGHLEAAVGEVTRRGEIAVSQPEIRQLSASKLSVVSPASSLISVGVIACDSLGVVELLGTSGQAAFSAGTGSHFRSLTTKVKATSHEFYSCTCCHWLIGAARWGME